MQRIGFLVFLVCIMNSWMSCSGIAVYMIKKQVSSSASEEFNLNEKQEDWVEEKVEFHVETLRSKFLKEFIQIIDDGLKLYKDSLSKDEIKSAIDKLRDSARPYMQAIFTDCGVFVNKLSLEQWEFFKKRKREESKEPKPKLSPENEKKARLNRVLESYAELYGFLDQPQKEFISGLVKKNPEQFDMDVRIAFNASLFAQSASETVKDDIGPKNELENMRKSFSDVNEVMKKVGFDDFFERLKANQLKLADIDAMMNSKQRQSFVENWTDIRDELKSYIPD